MMSFLNSYVLSSLVCFLFMPIVLLVARGQGESCFDSALTSDQFSAWYTASTLKNYYRSNLNWKQFLRSLRLHKESKTYKFAVSIQEGKQDNVKLQCPIPHLLLSINKNGVNLSYKDSLDYLQHPSVPIQLKREAEKFFPDRPVQQCIYLSSKMTEATLYKVEYNFIYDGNWQRCIILKSNVILSDPYARTPIEISSSVKLKRQFNLSKATLYGTPYTPLDYENVCADAIYSHVTMGRVKNNECSEMKPSYIVHKSSQSYCRLILSYYGNVKFAVHNVDNTCYIYFKAPNCLLPRKDSYFMTRHSVYEKYRILDFLYDSCSLYDGECQDSNCDEHERCGIIQSHNNLSECECSGPFVLKEETCNLDSSIKQKILPTSRKKNKNIENSQATGQQHIESKLASTTTLEIVKTVKVSTPQIATSEIVTSAKVTAPEMITPKLVTTPVNHSAPKDPASNGMLTTIIILSVVGGVLLLCSLGVILFKHLSKSTFQ